VFQWATLQTAVLAEMKNEKLIAAQVLFNQI
jgi:hypothetical protein